MNHYKTKIVSKGIYTITITQKIRDNHTEGGFTYCITKGRHIVGTGSVSCGVYSKCVPRSDLIKMLDSQIDTDNN